MNLFEQLVQLTSQFEADNIEYALCGGLAMAVYTFPRATVDIDILIETQTLEKAKTGAKALGFSGDPKFVQFKDGAIQIYRLEKEDADSGDALMLDILLVTPQIKAAWETKKYVKWDGGQLPVVSPEGLIHLKLFRKSGQDEDDIKHLRHFIEKS